MIKKIFIILICIFIPSCSGPPLKYNPNTELVVHYQGKEVYRCNSITNTDNYIALNDLNKFISQKKELIIIFAADWCSSCRVTKKALKQANLKKQVFYVNIDEEWVQKLAALIEVKSIPFMLHTDKEGNFIQALVGPKEIILYLLLNFS